MKFTEAQLEKAFMSLLQEEKMTHLAGGEVRKTEFNGLAEPPTVYGHAVSEKVLIIEDLKKYLGSQYSSENITENEIDSIIRDLDRLPASDLYETNKTVMKMVSDGFRLKREDRNQKDIYIQLIDYSEREEYPLSEKYITKITDNLYRLECEIGNFLGVGRFILGLLGEVKIIEPETLKDYVQERLNAYNA